MDALDHIEGHLFKNSVLCWVDWIYCTRCFHITVIYLGIYSEKNDFVTTKRRVQGLLSMVLIIQNAIFLQRWTAQTAHASVKNQRKNKFVYGFSNLFLQK